MKLTPKKHIAILCLCCFLVLCPHASRGEEARLENIIVTNTRDDLLIYMDVEGAFREKMNKAITSGVPVTFSFLIDLYRVKNLWPDKKIKELKVTNTVKYDSLKKEYMIHRSWDKGNPIVTESFEEARRIMVQIDSLKIVRLKKLQKGAQYQIRAKAELSKKTLPFYLHYVLFFVYLWDFETDWYTIDFIY